MTPMRANLRWMATLSEVPFPLWRTSSITTCEWTSCCLATRLRPAADNGHALCWDGPVQWVRWARPERSDKGPPGSWLPPVQSPPPTPRSHHCPDNCVGAAERQREEHEQHHLYSTAKSSAMFLLGTYLLAVQRIPSQKLGHEFLDQCSKMLSLCASSISNGWNRVQNKECLFHQQLIMGIWYPKLHLSSDYTRPDVPNSSLGGPESGTVWWFHSSDSPDLSY